MIKNPFGKTVKPGNPYATYTDAAHGWTWKVLKLYKSPESSAKDPYARAFTFVTSPFAPTGEYGDTYLRDIGGILTQGPDVRAGKRE
jgi:hypothetical protein